MPINVLYIIWSLGLGGAERVVINLAKNLDKTRFRAFVCCLNEKGIFAEELEEQGIEVIALSKGGKFDFSIINKLIGVIRNHKIDIVHTHLWGANFWGRIAARLAKAKVIVATEHNADTWKSGLYFALDKFLSRWTDKIIAVSQSVKDFYSSNGIPERKIEVVFNGIEIPMSQHSRNQAIRDEFKIKNGEKIVTIIGRLVPQKGHRYLFEALRLLNGRYNIKLLVVGNGPLFSNLQSIARSPELIDKIIFTGLRNDVRDILEETDILVMPSLREGLPMVALEAMASGVPVVATKVGGIPELIEDKKTGILLQDHSPEAIARAVTQLFNDGDLRKSITEKANRKIQDNFTVSRMIAKTESMYQELFWSKA